MSPIARALANALLEHRRSVAASRPADLDGALIAYGDLWDRAGSPGDLALVGGYLKEVAAWCAEHGWPPLNSLAVNGKKRRPGRRYAEAAGCSLEGWEGEVRSCLEFHGYPEAA